MRSRAVFTRLSGIDQAVLDRGLALALAVCGLADELTGAEIFTRVHGSAATAVPFILLVSLPLAFRRSRPLAVLCMVYAAIAVDSLIVGKAPQGGEVLFPGLISLYTVGAHTALPRALTGFAIGFAGTLVEAVLDPEVVTVGDLVVVEGFFFVFMGGACWFAGRYVRGRRLDSALSEDRAARAERQQDALAQAAVAAERDRIARELHDVIAHSVSVMGVQAGAAERILESDPDRVREVLRSIQFTARESVGELRRLLGVLRAPSVTASLSPQPGIDTLESLLNENRQAGLDVDITMSGERPHLPAGVELSAYRIVQEALTNVRKHAPGAAAAVLIDFAPNEVRIEVRNDAAATVNGDASAGTQNGLLGMRERVGLYGGVLRAGPNAAGGFCVSARLPVEPAP